LKYQLHHVTVPGSGQKGDNETVEYSA